MKKTIGLTQLFVAFCILAGCAANDESAKVQTASASPPAETEATPVPTKTSAPSAEPESTSSSELEACSTEVQVAMEASIRSQTEALVAGDFELAHSYASPSFQSNVSVDSFALIISSGFRPLLTAENLTFSNCLNSQGQDLGVIDVRFVESEGNLIGSRYLLVATDEGWRIDAAGNLALIATES